MEDIVIKRVTLNDIAQLQAIGTQTFFETFAESNTAEDITKYLSEGFSIEKLTSEVSNKDSMFYFAIYGNDIVGYLKLNTNQAQTELKDNSALEIERIYVLRKFHGKKVGQLLYEKAIHTATQVNVSYIWLGVWEKNQRAIAFYTKNGFVEFDKHIFRLGNDEQTDIMMKRVL